VAEGIWFSGWHAGGLWGTKPDIGEDGVEMKETNPITQRRKGAKPAQRSDLTERTQVERFWYEERGNDGTNPITQRRKGAKPGQRSDLTERTQVERFWYEERWK
jgi:hypothetical protein